MLEWDAKSSTKEGHQAINHDASFQRFKQLGEIKVSGWNDWFILN